MKRLLLLAASATVLILSAASIFAAQRLSAAESAWLDKLQASGLQLSWQEAPRWQFFPPALQAQGLVLRSAEGELLRSASLRLKPDLSDILAGRMASLQLQDAQIFYQTRTDGSSNWDALLQQTQGQGLHEIRLLNTAISISSVDSNKPFLLTLKNLNLHDLDTPQAAVAADILFSRQENPQDNLLVEATLTSGLQWQRGQSLTLENLQLASTISSTRLPGVLSTQSQGKLLWQQGRLSSPALQTRVSYSLPGSTATHADIKTLFILDVAQQELSLQAFALSTATYALQAADLLTNMDAQQPELKAQQMTFTLAGKPSRALTLTDITLQPATSHSGHDFIVAGRLGKGRISLPLALTLTPDHIAASLNGDLQNIELADLRSLLRDNSAHGQLNAKFSLQLQGRSRNEIRDSASGNFSLTLKQAQLQGSNIMPMLRERLHDYASLLPEMQPADAAADKSASLRKLHIRGSLQNGVLTTPEINADIGLARIQAAGRYDSRKRFMDYQGNLHLDAALFVTEKAGLDLALVCAGNFQDGQLSFAEGLATDCRVADEAKRDLLARALIQKFRN